MKEVERNYDVNSITNSKEAVRSWLCKYVGDEAVADGLLRLCAESGVTLSLTHPCDSPSINSSGTSSQYVATAQADLDDA